MGEHRLRATSRFGGRRWAWVAAAVLLLTAAAGTAAALVNPSLLHRLGLAGAVAVIPEVTPPVLRIGPLAADAPTPGSTGLAAELDKLAGVKELGTLTGVVLDPTTDRTLWSRNPTKALTPGSTGKLLTAAATLLTLNPTSRLTTRVVAGPTPDAVVLVGGGDPTLSVLPAGQESVYPGAAKLNTLLDAVRAAHPAPIRTVTVDLTRYRGPVLAPGWLPADVPGGYVTPIQPLILDGGRATPSELDGPRTTTPGLDAGKEVAKRLGADPGLVREQTAPAGAATLGEVSSPPITDLVQTALRISDNVLAEVLAREVAIAKGGEPSFPGATRAVLATLIGAGLEVGETKIVDGSGLSTADQVPAQLLGQIMAAAAAPAQSGTGASSAAGSPPPGSSPPGSSAPAVTGSSGAPDRTDRAARLRPLLGGLPVAGGDGTLDARFRTGPSAPGRGYVRAKTGTLTGVSSLAGAVIDADGRLLVFTWLSNGTSPADSRPRLDALAAALRTCGCR
ncbi:MAG: D-alanyl-D-alanine carboxypeptidase/D-alanyl-D-alanine-endopeptidase [Pseudonocardia sp.]